MREPDPIADTAKCFIYAPLEYTGRGPTYTYGSIAAHLPLGGIAPTLFTPRAFAPVPRAVGLSEAAPVFARKLPYRLIERSARHRLDDLYLRAVRRARGEVIAYLWPDAPLPLIEELRATGAMLVREMINCFRGTAKAILDDAYGRAGLPPDHGISEASVRDEAEALGRMDWVFASNPCVEASLIEAGVEARRILPVGYGWEPGRFAAPAPHRPDRPFTAVFVGRLCVRKGVHLLLDAWAASGIEGRLVLAGAIEPALRPLIAHHLARDDVEHLGYVADVGEVFRSADIFCFPTLEEGGPMVTIEAAGCGLPILTSPMGAARIVDESNGRVVEPYDHDGLVAALQLLAGDAALRSRMGAVSRARAAQVTWADIGRRRGELLRRAATDMRSWAR